MDFRAQEQVVACSWETPLQGVLRSHMCMVAVRAQAPGSPTGPVLALMLAAWPPCSHTLSEDSSATSEVCCGGSLVGKGLACA